MDRLEVAALLRRAEEARRVATALRGRRRLEESRLMERRIQDEEAAFWDARREGEAAPLRRR